MGKNSKTIRESKPLDWVEAGLYSIGVLCAYFAGNYIGYPSAVIIGLLMISSGIYVNRVKNNKLSYNKYVLAVGGVLICLFVLLYILTN